MGACTRMQASACKQTKVSTYTQTHKNPPAHTHTQMHTNTCIEQLYTEHCLTLTLGDWYNMTEEKSPPSKRACKTKASFAFSSRCPHKLIEAV